MTWASDESFDISVAMGVFDYLPQPVAFLRKMAAQTNAKVIASFPGHSAVRECLRTLRYRLSGKGRCSFTGKPTSRGSPRSGPAQHPDHPIRRQAPATSLSARAGTPRSDRRAVTAARYCSVIT